MLLIIVYNFYLDFINIEYDLEPCQSRFTWLVYLIIDYDLINSISIISPITLNSY